ncbi:MAG: PH domain-containing protein [Pseudomonadota bacterium]
MFKRVASEALGLSDIGKIIGPEDYDKVEADDYVMHEEEEKIYFLIKSKQDEYCFTNEALIHVDGTTALSKKRMLRRKSYYNNVISEVFLETAGTIDMDVEIKFRMGDESYSIDVDKNQIEQLKDLYKALLKIASIQSENSQLLSYAYKSLDTAASAIARGHDSTVPEAQFKTVNEYSFAWMKRSYASYVRKDFGDVFAKFINN